MPRRSAYSPAAPAHLQSKTLRTPLDQALAADRATTHSEEPTLIQYSGALEVIRLAPSSTHLTAHGTLGLQSLPGLGSLILQLCARELKYTERRVSLTRGAPQPEDSDTCGGMGIFLEVLPTTAEAG